MPNIIDIHQQAPLNPENLPVIIYHKQRVISTELLAQGYGTDGNNIQQNFKRNKERFIEGKHYYKVEGEELKAFRNQLTVSRLINIQHAGIIPRWVPFRLSGGKCPQITLH
ncbi:ORF6N domain-containing protein [Candidatus Fukatsuia symbiotica]|uniref:KilA-N DNA-binding domain-containing protein n=1 Tax=Candidatus Fukatsuia symbiotica TaxID=1878942 RepID=A0A2Y9CKB7_9GAMM|nr:ORF6N domain-containing protein [Candidatus Fukatsuia symbiotica]AWK13288.1 hypothetical protein CCS41_00340 [Candidatus Fukatsuia symbiotica]MEA9444162.1 ORF6N domain-containing protein [Candidatus Fukatsuia symbiotica]